MILIWLAGLVAGLVGGAVLMAQVALGVKLLVALGVLALSLAGRFGSLLLAGALVGIGALSFVILALTGDPGQAAAGPALAAVSVAAGLGMTLRRAWVDRAGRSI